MNDKITIFAETNYRNSNVKFGIKTDDRRRHMYFIGKTGMGKSTVLENMIIQDIQDGKGVCVVDPHGDLVEKVINFVPSSRINDVIYFNPAAIHLACPQFFFIFIIWTDFKFLNIKLLFGFFSVDASLIIKTDTSASQPSSCKSIFSKSLKTDCQSL